MTRRAFVLVNYKVYAEATGSRAVDLTRALAKAADGVASADVVVAPQAADLHRVAGATSLRAFAQHVDALAAGAGTGATLPEAAKDAGARGALVNHAERRLTLAEIDAVCRRLSEIGLTRVVCTNNAETSRAAAALAPEYVAIEPPELIGGDVSVTSADPGIVRRSVDAVRAVNPNVRVLCGAGIKSGDDLRAALDLGCDGVLLASGIVKAADPTRALAGLLSKI